MWLPKKIITLLCLLLCVIGCKGNLEVQIITSSQNGYIQSANVKFSYMNWQICYLNDVDNLIDSIQKAIQSLNAIKKKMHFEELFEAESVELFASELKQRNGSFDSAKIDFLATEFEVTNQQEVDILVEQFQVLLKNLEEIREEMIQDEKI